jgi:hypothetical protein
VPKHAESAFDFDGFGRLPVLANGRIKPLDSVGRNSLLILQGRQRVITPDDAEITPVEWLLNVTFRPEIADTYRTFEIDNRDVLINLLGQTEESLHINYESPAKRVMALFGFLPSTYRRFPFSEISPHLDELDRQAKLADSVDAQLRTRFQKAVVSLQANLMAYQRLKYSLAMPDSPDFLSEITQFQKNLPKGVAAARAKQAGQPADDATLKELAEASNRFEFMGRAGSLLAVPPADVNSNDWLNVGQSLTGTFQTGNVDAGALVYAGLAHAWKLRQPEQFNKIVELYRAELAHRFAPQLKKTEVEVRFNAAEPFYVSMNLYVLAFIVAIFSWLKWPDILGKSAFYLIIVAWLTATAGSKTPSAAPLPAWWASAPC